MEYRYPDVTYTNEKELQVGGLTFHLYHALGETDDATWYFSSLLQMILIIFTP